jgi:hypothetical protein
MDLQKSADCDSLVPLTGFNRRLTNENDIMSRCIQKHNDGSSIE